MTPALSTAEGHLVRRLLAQLPQETSPGSRRSSCSCSSASPARNSPKIDAASSSTGNSAEEREVGDPRGQQVALRALVTPAGPGQVVEPGEAPPQPADEGLATGVEPGPQRLARRALRLLGTHLPESAAWRARRRGAPAASVGAGYRGGPVSRYSRATAHDPVGVCSNSVNDSTGNAADRSARPL